MVRVIETGIEGFNRVPISTPLPTSQADEGVRDPCADHAVRATDSR